MKVPTYRAALRYIFWLLFLSEIHLNCRKASPENILPEPTSSIPWPSATAAAVSTDTFNSSVISPDPPRTNVSRVYPVKKAQLSPTLNIESVRGSGNSEAGAAIPELITDEKVIQKSGKQTCWDILYFKTHQLS